MNDKAKILLYVYSFVFLVCPVLGQGLPEITPEQVGLSSARLDRINKAVNEYIESNNIAGAVTAISRRGKIAHFKSYGLMDIEADKSMSKDAMFRIASMSKPITSTAVMILYEEGYFLLSDPVSKYIPEFANPKVITASSTPTSIEFEPAKREIAIRHLLNHTSGITYGEGLHSKLYSQAKITSGLGSTEGTIEEMVKKLARQPLISHPGEEFHYGLSIDVLGYLVEVVSGMSLDEFLKQRIFIPLKMPDTHFVLPKSKLSKLAKNYRRTDDGKLEIEDVDLSYLLSQTYFAGGAGLVSTASDYMRFAQMILNKGELDGVRILSRKTVELMTSNSIGDLYASFRPNSGDKFGYGFGIRTERGEYDELESLGIIGWDGAFYTRFWIDPEEQLIGIFMSQAQDNWNSSFVNKYRVLVYQAIDD
jgi:CubicO group peptidase (beta-lactamase class C family)